MVIPDWIAKHLPDPDQVFAYDTVKLVRVLDRRLGIIYWTIQFLVFVYMMVVVFMVNEGYQDTEKTNGWILTKLSGSQMDHLGLSWDTYSRITNPGESGAVFIPTRVLITRGQTQENEYCASPLHTCKIGKDCDIGNPLQQKLECNNGFCMRRQWCPAENPIWKTTETHYLEFEEVDLMFSSFVHFHKFGNDVTTADENVSVHYPQQGANTYNLGDVLRMTNLAPEEFVENGAVLTLNSIFDCNLDQGSCAMSIQTVNVDTQTGFNYVHNNIYFENGVRKRDSYRMFGIRLLTFAVGFAGKTSFSQILLQVSTAIALLGTAELVADFWMSNCVPERRHYTEQKIIPMEVYSD